MADIEKHEEEGARAFDPHLARRLLRYLRPYRWRATFSVVLVILSSLLEITGPAIIAVAIDLFVRPLNGAAPVGFSARIAQWLNVTDPLRGIDLASLFYLVTLLGNFVVLYTQMV